MTEGPARPGLDLPRIGSYVFMGFGAAIVAVGVAIVFDDPGGFAAIAFGLVFIGAGYVCRRVFAVPPGKRLVSAEGHEAHIATWGGAQGTRSQSVLIEVDADASETEVAEARAAWLREQWAARPDWARGVVRSDDVKHGGLAWLGAALWSVFALGALGAALAWGDIAWLVAAGSGMVALGFVGNAVRIALRRRKFGDSLLRLAQTPLALGGRVEGEVQTGVSRRLRIRDGFALTLACVHRWEETRGSGSDRRTHFRRDTLWQAEARHPGRTDAGSEGVVVPVSFALPADKPAASLGAGNEGILWELTVRAALPGLDYQAVFELPVLEPGAARVLAD